MNLGEMIDTLYAKRQERLLVAKEVDRMKAEETAMRAQIMEELDNQGTVKASGSMATCGLTSSVEPVVNDWDEVHEFIKTMDRFDLVQKRISAPAWRELLDSGVLVPGTEQMYVRDVSLTKSTRG